MFLYLFRNRKEMDPKIQANKEGDGMQPKEQDEVYENIKFHR